MNPLARSLKFRARLEALARTAFYASTAALGWRVGFPYSQIGKEYGKHAIREAYELQAQMLGRPEVRRALHQSERRDLMTFPLFALGTPFDVARVLRKRVLRQRRLTVRPPDAFPYPRYYLNDFHHQANGNLSMRAALGYEWQVRFLFFGASRLMRQAVIDALPPGDGQQVLDVGCGTGAWIGQARAQGRLHPVTGVDLSPQYLRLARLFQRQDTQFLQANAEALPEEWTGRFDTVISIWLFHELPHTAMRNVTEQIARVLKPGGRLIFMDAAQPEDLPDDPHSVERISEHFRDVFNEPYFRIYQGVNLSELFAEHGLKVIHSSRCFASKLNIAEKSA